MTSPSAITGPQRSASPPLSSQIPASSAASGHTSTVIPIFSSTAGLLFLPQFLRLDDLAGAGLRHADPLRERRERQLLFVSYPQHFGPPDLRCPGAELVEFFGDLADCRRLGGRAGHGGDAVKGPR